MRSGKTCFPTRTGLACLSTILAWALAGTPAVGQQPTGSGSYLATKAFSKPELYLSTSNAPLAQVLNQLPNRAAWQRFQLAAKAAAPGGGTPAYIDRRFGTAASIIGSLPLLPKLGRGLDSGDESSATVLAAVKRFVREHRDVLGIDVRQLGAGHATQVTPELWQVTIPQVYRGVPVRFGRLAATIKYGNLLLIGTETWGDVKRIPPRKARLTAEEALRSGFDHAGGDSVLDRVVRPPALEILPVAVDDPVVGRGYRHVLVWSFAFVREDEVETWGVWVDARTGEVLSFEDENHYADKAPSCASTWGPTLQCVGFSRSDSLTCRNPGEIASILDHEWGHGLDDNDANLTLSSSSEGYADIAAIYRLHASCIGEGFRTPSTTPSNCGPLAGDTFANEAPLSKPPHCDLACTGFRDADWNLHAPPGSPVAKVPAPVTSYVDDDVGAGRTYYYNVVAAADSSSEFSDANCASENCSGGKPCNRVCVPL